MTFSRKKPLNQLENPIQPFIQKSPPRFVWSGKNWKIGPEAARDTEHITQFYEDAILVQSRDYNKTIYGQSSHKDIVNGAFRPPLLNYYEDYGPLNRLPVKLNAIVPRINPGTAGFDNGTSSFSAQTARMGVSYDKELTDRVKSQPIVPTFYLPIETPQEIVEPDLELNIPSTSQDSGRVYPERGIQNVNITLDCKKINPPGITGYNNTNFEINNTINETEKTFKENRPIISVSSGDSIPIYTPPSFKEEQLYTNVPHISVDSGTNLLFEDHNYTPLYPQLKESVPSVSVTSSKNYISLDPPHECNLEFDYNRPSYSYIVDKNYGDISSLQDVDVQTRDVINIAASSGEEYTFKNEDNVRPQNPINLEYKLQAPLQITNIGDSESGYHGNVEFTPDSRHIRDRIKYSYSPRAEFNYTYPNGRSHKPHHHEKLIPEKGYGKLFNQNAHPLSATRHIDGMKTFGNGAVKSQKYKHNYTKPS